MINKDTVNIDIKEMCFNNVKWIELAKICLNGAGSFASDIRDKVLE
jgi:hypothetical protein